MQNKKCTVLRSTWFWAVIGSFFHQSEALQFALSKGKIFLAMPKDAVNPSNNCALTILGSTGTEWWSFRDRHALTEEERELSYKYLFDEEE
jgi:hypothetical protein